MQNHLKTLINKGDFATFSICQQEKITTLSFAGKVRREQSVFFYRLHSKKRKMYEAMRDYGYEVIFKPVIGDGNSVKGNVDAELVLQVMHEYQNYNKAVIVSGDGDFYCLVKYRS